MHSSAGRSAERDRFCGTQRDFSDRLIGPPWFSAPSPAFYRCLRSDGGSGFRGERGSTAEIVGDRPTVNWFTDSALTTDLFSHKTLAIVGPDSLRPVLVSRRTTKYVRRRYKNLFRTDGAKTSERRALDLFTRCLSRSIEVG